MSSADFRLLRTNGQVRRRARNYIGVSSGQKPPCPDVLRSNSRNYISVFARLLRSTRRKSKNWLREVLFAGWTGGDHREIWNDLLRRLTHWREKPLLQRDCNVHTARNYRMDRPVEESLRHSTRYSSFGGRSFTRTEDETTSSELACTYRTLSSRGSRTANDR